MSAEKITSNQSKNKRREIRRILHERCVVELGFTASKHKGVSRGIALDMSNSGLGVIVSSYVRPATKVTISLSTKEFQYEFVATVAWCNELPVSGHIIKEDGSRAPWRVGLFFEKRSEEEEQLIRSLAQTL